MAPRRVVINHDCKYMLAYQYKISLYLRYEKFLEHSKTTHAMGRVGSSDEVGKFLKST